jgi:hypothetical protein
MNAQDIELLINTLPARKDGPAQRPPEFAIRLLEETCARTGLDWKMRHVYLMQRGGKWMVTLSIDGFRLVGAQDPDYVGQEGPLFVLAPDGTWTDIPTDRPPYAAKVGIKHRNGTTTWGVAKFSDYKASPMWDKFPSTMTAKCAEMLAWRKAFPGRLGGLYGVEEMAQSEKQGSEAPPVKEGDVDALKNTYVLELERTKSLDDVLAIGRRIQSDKTLPHSAVMELHKTYTLRKASYER